MTGRFLVTRLDYAGDFNGERSYTLSLESRARWFAHERGESRAGRGGGAGRAARLLVLRPSFAALVAAEQELGPLFALVERAAEGRLALGEMVALFWHCLARAARRADAARRSARASRRRGLAASDAGAAGAARADIGGAVMHLHRGRRSATADGGGWRECAFGWTPETFWQRDAGRSWAVRWCAALAGERTPAPLRRSADRSTCGIEGGVSRWMRKSSGW